MDFIDKINTVISRIVSWLVLILILELIYDTIMRYLFNVAVEWSFDISYMLYGIIFMLAIPYVEHINKHVRIEVVYNILSPRIQIVIDIIGYIFIYLPVSIALLYFGWNFFYESFTLRETSGASMWAPPIYPFKFIIPLTGFLLLLQTISELIKRIHMVRKNHI